MDIDIDIDMCVCLCVCVQIDFCIFSVPLSVCLSVCLSLHTPPYTRLCVWVYIVCMCKFTCVYVYIHICTYTCVCVLLGFVFRRNHRLHILKTQRQSSGCDEVSGPCHHLSPPHSSSWFCLLPHFRLSPGDSELLYLCDTFQRLKNELLAKLSFFLHKHDRPC